MRRRATHPLGWLTAALLFAGCGSSAQMARSYAMPPPPAQPMMAEAATATGSADVTPSAPGEAAPAPPSDEGAAQRVAQVPGGPVTNAQPNGAPANNAQAQAPAPAPMLIYTGDVDLQTARDQVTPTIDRVIEAATAMGGYLLRRTDTSVQVRVPSGRFREGLRRVEDFGEVLHRSVSAQDVSEEFHDMEVRLQNLRAVRRRLEEFLTRAGSMAEALQVERELERITREIDAIEGRMRFLSARVAFSLLTVNVHARPDTVAVAGPPIPPRRALQLPVSWFNRIGLENLLNTSE
ncbi:MAG: DUF4349 domain-containing protein [Polyangiales bacterium]